MRAHGAYRVDEGGSVVKLKPVERMVVVADPVLRIIMEHCRVITPASAGASFEQDIRVRLDDLIHHTVESKYVPVIDFALSLRRQLVGPDISQGTVDVPLDIEDVGVVKDRVDILDQIVLHVSSAHIQSHLVTAPNGMAPRDLHSPFRMCAVQIAVFRYHLRLEPDTELHIQIIDLLYKLVQTAFDLVCIHIPVAQSAVVVVAFAEPSIVHDQQIDAHIPGCLGDLDKLHVVEIHECRFPTVDKDRTLYLLDEFAAAQVRPVEIVVQMGQSGESVLGKCHDDFRPLKDILRF